MFSCDWRWRIRCASPSLTVAFRGACCSRRVIKPIQPRNRVVHGRPIRPTEPDRTPQRRPPFTVSKHVLFGSLLHELIYLKLTIFDTALTILIVFNAVLHAQIRNNYLFSFILCHFPRSKRMQMYAFVCKNAIKLLNLLCSTKSTKIHPMNERDTRQKPTPATPLSFRSTSKKQKVNIGAAGGPVNPGLSPSSQPESSPNPCPTLAPHRA